MKKIGKVFTIISAVSIGLGLSGCDSIIDDNTIDTASSYEAYVMVDINPSFGFYVNENGTVSTAMALNEDGEVLLVNLDLEGKNINQAAGLLVEEAMQLGYINANNGEVTVSVDATSEDDEDANYVRELVKLRLQETLQNKGVATNVQNKVYEQAFIGEASANGLSPVMYRLALMAYNGSSDLTMDEAKTMTKTQLMQQIKADNSEQAHLMQSLRADMVAEKQAVHDEYLPQIQALEAQIEAAIAAGEDTTELQTQLDTLKAEMHSELDAIKDYYQTESQTIKAQVRTQNTNRRNQYGSTAN